MQRNVGLVMLLAVTGLIALGLVMLFSASAKAALDNAGAVHVQKQAFWLFLGALVCVLISRTDYHMLTKHAWVLVGISVLLLLLCFAPYIGKKAKGAARWISLFGYTFQPSELAKLALVLFLAHWLGKHQRRVGEFVTGFGVPLAVLAVFSLILMKQPDLGYTVHLGTIFFIVLFCAGVRWYYLAPFPLVGVGGILAMAWMMPERQGRLLAFMDIEKYKLTDGYQVYQALIALGSGGLTGLGLGNSRQKMYYLPEAHNDFIFPIIGEELGLWIALAVVMAFFVLVLCGGWISMHAPDPTGVLLGIGVTALIGIQAFMNLAVVTSMMPNKGVPLPFISSGGSNLLLCMACIGILFNLQRQGLSEMKPQKAPLPRRSSPRM
jgi:cell division protein FtsW